MSANFLTVWDDVFEDKNENSLPYLLMCFEHGTKNKFNGGHVTASHWVVRGLDIVRDFGTISDSSSGLFGLTHTTAMRTALNIDKALKRDRSASSGGARSFKEAIKKFSTVAIPHVESKLDVPNETYLVSFRAQWFLASANISFSETKLPQRERSVKELAAARIILHHFGDAKGVDIAASFATKSKWSIAHTRKLDRIYSLISTI